MSGFHFSACTHMPVKCTHRTYKYTCSWPMASSPSVADAVGTLLLSSSPYLLRAYLANFECQHPQFTVRVHCAICLAASSGELTYPGSRIQPMTDGSQNTQLPPHGWVSVCSADSQSSPGGLDSSCLRVWPV